MEQNTSQEEQKKTAIEAEVKPVSPVTATTEVQADSVENKNMKMFGMGLAGVVVATVLICAGVGIFKVYAKASTDNFTITVAKVLRLPIMKVNGESVLYANYAEDMLAIKQLVAFDKANNGNSASLTSEQMSDQVLWRLANNLLVKSAAAKYDVKLDAKDVDDLKANLLKQFKDQAEIEKEIQSRYGWTFAQYEEKVIKNYILQQKIGEKIQTDQKAREEIRNKAMVVLNEIKAGKDFAEQAKTYGEDGTNVNGGDLGWFGKGDMVPTFENAAYALKAGEVTQDLIETEYGYHIIKLVARKMEKGKDAKGKTVNVEKIQASHILFRFPSPETFMDTLAKTAKYDLYVKIHNPFKELNETPEETVATTTK